MQLAKAESEEVGYTEALGIFLNNTPLQIPELVFSVKKIAVQLRTEHPVFPFCSRLCGEF